MLDQVANPLGFEAGDANVSRYVGNAPTNATDPSGLTVVGKAAGKISKKAAIKILRGRIKKHFKEGLLQLHHIIAEKLFQKGQFGDFLKDLGFDKDDLFNVIPLPTRAGKEAAAKAGKACKRSVHDGGHVAKYFDDIAQRLDDLQNAFKAGKISKEVARNGVLEIQKGLREGLRNGTIPLHKFHEEYLSIALLGLTAVEIEQLSEELAELAAAEVDKVLACHRGNQLRASHYTGSEGAWGWLGFGVDLFNPLDDIALIGDIIAFFDFDPTKESAEEYLERSSRSVRKEAETPLEQAIELQMPKLY
jgi:hypothetical protein